MKFRGVWILLGVASLALGNASGAERSFPVVVGQLMAEGGSVDGLPVPPGTTILEGSVVGATSRPAALRLVNGQTLEIGRHSSALLEKQPSGEILVQVRTGTVSYLGAAGSVSTLPAAGAGLFSQRQAGRPIQSSRDGLVAVVAKAGDLERADQGERRVPVNDSSRVQPTRELLLQTSLSRREPSPQRYVQEVACGIESVRDNIIRLNEDLVFTHEPQDLVIQSSRLPESKVYTRLERSVAAGVDLLEVLDSKPIHPLERIVLRTPDRSLREVACVRYTEEDLSEDADARDIRSVVKIRAGLENAFVTGSEILQGRQFESERVVTTLAKDASQGQRNLQVVDPGAIDPLQQVMIRSLDGKLFEAYCVYYIKEARVSLAEALDHDYPAGAQIIQGKSSQELIASGVALQRTANCCCCCGPWLVPGAVVTRHVNPLWYIIGGGAAAGGVAGLTGGGGGGGSPGGGGPLPPPASQVAP